MFKKIPFLNLFVSILDINEWHKIQPASHIVSLNLEQVILAQDDLEFREIIQSAELVIPDGASIVLALKYFFSNDLNLEKESFSKLAGIDLASKFIENKKKLALLGSTQEVIDTLKKKYKDQIVFAHHGYFEEDQMDDIAKKIQESKPEVLLVAMGAPKQEKFIHKYKNLFVDFISMGVGGSLDCLSGKLSRAPRFMIDLNLEWFFRLLQEPSRIKRILVKVPRYFFLLFFFKFKKG